MPATCDPLTFDEGTRHTPAVTSVRKALLKAVPALASASVPSPRLDAEVLLAHVLAWQRAGLYARPEQLLTPEQLKMFSATVDRRCRHEPVPYIVGHRPFYGLDFKVDGRVLIPRPETELLVEQALVAARHLTAGCPGALIADVGTGSGIVAVCLAANLRSCSVVATDVSGRSLPVAAANARKQSVADRVHLVQSDLLGFMPRALRVIAANLPYVPTGELATLAEDVRCYEPLIALDGGPDGLTHIRRFLQQAGSWLLPGGALLLEVGAGQAGEVAALASFHYPAARIRRFSDYAGFERVVSVDM